MKDKNPEEGWAKIIRGPFDFLAKRNVPKGWTPGAIDEVKGKADLYVRFLKKFDYQNMERQAVGLGLLCDMPLNLIAQNFDVHDGDTPFDLNVKPMDIAMREAMKARGWKNGYKQYFANDQNRREASEAVAYMFYLRATKDPQNREDVEFVEDVRETLIPGSSLSKLSIPPSFRRSNSNRARYSSTDPRREEKMQLAQQKYVRLVAAGREMCRNDGSTLGTFVQANVDLSSQVDYGSLAQREVGKTAPSVPASGIPASDVPRGGRNAPGTSDSGSDAPDTAGSGTSSVENPSGGTSAPDTPDMGNDAVPTPDTGARVLPAPKGGRTSPETPQSGRENNDIPPAGEKNPTLPPSGRSAPDTIPESKD